MAYADYSQGGGDLDIYLTMSDDHGESWSNPRRLNDDPHGPFIDQFHPWVCVDTNGVVTVVFYDRRNDTGNLLMDLYFAQSSDRGDAWVTKCQDYYGFQRPHRRFTSRINWGICWLGFL